MLEQILKGLHLMAGTTFLGLTIATLFYVGINIHKQNSKTLSYALQASFFADGLIFIIILYQFYSGTFLAQSNHIAFSTPWLKVAYLAFTIVSFLWLLSCLLRIYNYKQTKQTAERFNYSAIFYLINIIMLIIFVFIIHDAVTQSTYFGFLA